MTTETGGAIRRERDQTDAGQCKDCHWSGWHLARTHFNTRDNTAQCRRFPPTRHSLWPTVIHYDGCGEFKEIANAPVEGESNA